jgi:programmed cell death 6-interacting protein
MVKLAAPTEVADPIGWLMGGGAGQEPLFSALVPYGVHLALSKLYLSAFQTKLTRRYIR